ncbi:hypothetical protein AB6A40_004342 [Gnathostoma spinigerum]|uniref:SPK domain-containing protein n=1 Tax=Gnathostoma spinigerum TaxID=75299 RepID=A0ABD6EC75_9BILA
MASVRSKYTDTEEFQMWSFLYEKLKQHDPAALNPKGLKIWQMFAGSHRTNKSVSSLATHFRRCMFDSIYAADLPINQLFYIASRLHISFEDAEVEIMERRFKATVKLNRLRNIVAYKVNGKAYSVKFTDTDTDSDEADALSIDSLSDMDEYGLFNNQSRKPNKQRNPAQRVENDIKMEHESEETKSMKISSSNVGTCGKEDSRCYQSASSSAEPSKNRTLPSATQQISNFTSLFAPEHEANASGPECQNSETRALEMPSHEVESCQKPRTTLIYSSPHAVNNQHVASKSDDRSDLSAMIKEFKQTLEETSDCCRIEQLDTEQKLEYIRTEAGDNAERFFELLRSIVSASEKQHTLICS